MNESKARRAGQALIVQAGIDDMLTAIGAFYPRGRALREGMGWVAGGIAGEAVGGAIGGVGEAVGSTAGVVLGSELGADIGERRGPLPPRVFLASGARGVYIFGARKRGRVPRELVGRLPADAAMRVRQRITVRVVELTSPRGTTIAVEGVRGPWTHSKLAIVAIGELRARQRRARRV